MNPPKITVFMAAYNAEKYIRKAISSILQQSFEDFELLIVNDGSTDDTVAEVQAFDDPRIRLIHNTSNQGLVFTRNRALEEARGEFIAVLDSDDIAVPERLQLQYEFMEQHPEVALCSGHAALIDAQGALTGQQFIVPTDFVNMEVFFGNPFINPAAMFRADILREFDGYRDFAPAEDFDFFVRVSEKYPVANLDHLLVYYRVHNQNTSAIKPAETRAIETAILKDMYNRWGMSVDDRFLDLHYLLFSKSYHAIGFSDILKVVTTLKLANESSPQFLARDFEAVIFNKWYEIIMIKKPGKTALSLLFKRDLFRFSFLTFKQLRRTFKQSLKSYFKAR
jgi:glycosyltransferase involved in cell wall biosynthesis